MHLLTDNRQRMTDTSSPSPAPVATKSEPLPPCVPSSSFLPQERHIGNVTTTLGGGVDLCAVP